MSDQVYDPDAPAPAPNKRGRKPTPDVKEPAPARTALLVNDGDGAPTADASISPEARNRQLLKADIERIRKMRKPFGTMTQKLALEQRPGYHRHWFNDEPGRVEEAANNGWAHVTDKEGKPVKRVVGRGRDNSALYAFAMELPKIFWDEDMAARHDAASARIDEIRKKPFRAKPGQAEASDRGKFYDPTEGSGVVQMKTTVARTPPPSDEAA